MPNIRFRRFASASPDGWELDCFVLPDDNTSGELVHFHPNQIREFNQIKEPGLFDALEKLLDQIAVGNETPKKDVRLVLGRLKDDKKTYYSLRSLDDYPVGSPEAEIWELINAVHEKRLKGLQ